MTLECIDKPLMCQIKHSELAEQNVYRKGYNKVPEIREDMVKAALTTASLKNLQAWAKNG